MSQPLKLRRLTSSEVTSLEVEAVTSDTLQVAAAILEDVKKGGEKALLEYAVRFKDIAAGEKHILKRDAELKAAFVSLPVDQQKLLERTATRIRTFAEAQKHSVNNLVHAVAGGRAGHTVTAVESAGCYAPGGRYPLPSSVLMTVITARVAGVSTVWVASPRPAAITLAAAYVAGADALLAVGGAQAIAAFANGAGEVPKCDAVVGPGNKYVTAAKQLIAGRATIDMLAGPSECLVLVDKTSNPAVVAADLIAQAEHDPEARPIVVNVIYNSENDIVQAIEEELQKQLATLPTADVARQAIQANGVAVVVKGLDEAVKICDKFAPEHLELHVENAENLKGRLRFYGSLFVGSLSAEVFGDYGAGPNHVLPTGGTARANAGLSVFTFLKVRTWLEISDANAARQIMEDAAALAKLEGLHGHAAASEIRLRSLTAPATTKTDKPEMGSLFKTEIGTSVEVSPERPLHIAAPTKTDVVVKLALPKGRMEQGIFKLLNDAGLSLKVEARGYRPTFGVPGFDVKLLKPQNIVEMVNLGSRDIGFTGADLVEELGAKGVTRVS